MFLESCFVLQSRKSKSKKRKAAESEEEEEAYEPEEEYVKPASSSKSKKKKVNNSAVGGDSIYDLDQWSWSVILEEAFMIFISDLRRSLWSFSVQNKITSLGRQFTPKIL